MLNFIVLTLIVFCLGTILFSNRRKAGFEPNFILFFCIGYSYYFASPIIFYSFFTNMDLEEFDVIRRYLGGVENEGMILYGVLSLAYFLLTIFGYFHGGNTKKVFNVKNNNFKINLILLFSIILSVLSAIPIYDNFFKGYDESIFEGYADGVVAGAVERGTYVASVSMLFVCCLIKLSSSFLRAKDSKSAALYFYIKSPEFFIYIFFAVLMVSMGGRLYLISSMIALCVMASRQRIYYLSFSKIIIIFISLSVLLGLYGVFRAKGPISFGSIALNLVQEPLYTSISLFSYVGGNYWEAFRFPYFLLSDFSNILPSFIWSNKASFLLKPMDMGFDIAIPLGGFHLFVSLLINFGYIGAGVFMFFFGWFIGRLEKRAYNWKHAVIYSLIVGWCTFSLFRDPFSVSLIKNIFQFSIVFPLLIFSIVSRSEKSTGNSFPKCN